MPYFAQKGTMCWERNFIFIVKNIKQAWIGNDNTLIISAFSVWMIITFIDLNTVARISAYNSFETNVSRTWSILSVISYTWAIAASFSLYTCRFYVPTFNINLELLQRARWMDSNLDLLVFKWPIWALRHFPHWQFSHQYFSLMI